MLHEGLHQPENEYENLDHVRNYLQNEDTTKELLSYVPAENAPPPPNYRLVNPSNYLPAENAPPPPGYGRGKFTFGNKKKGGSKSRRTKSRRTKSRRTKSRRTKSRNF